MSKTIRSSLIGLAGCSYNGIRALLLVLPLLWTASAFAHNEAEADSDIAAREAFRRAYAAIDAAAPESEPEDSEALKAYAIYPYLQAARIEHALARAGLAAGTIDPQAAAFLTAHDTEPVGRDLRRIWLRNLAERKQWHTFLAHYREGVADDGLRCDWLAARIEQHQFKDLAAAVAERWLSPHEIPRNCDPAFAWLRAEKKLTPALIEQRARLALTEGEIVLARKLAAGLPASAAAPLLQWAVLIEQPLPHLDALIAKPDTGVDAAALQDAWERLSRKDPEAAAQRYDALVRTRKLDAAQASVYARALALGLAWNRAPQASHYFAFVAPTDVDDSSAEWSARAALWAGDWAGVSKIVAAMPETQRTQPRWRYFAARAADRLGNGDAARAQYAQLAAEDGFYPALAAARIGQAYAPHPQPAAFDAPQIEQLAQRPALIRARELFRCRLKEDATAEWLYGLDGLSPSQRMQSIALAQRWGWYDQMVASASRSGVFADYALLYPRPYDVEVHAGATLTRLPETLIYGVMRQESLYRDDVVSHAGARGLLQLMPDTARRTAKHWQRPLPERADLFNPSINVTLGAAKLRDLLDAFGNQTVLALAAYNGGRNAVLRWLPAQAMDADVWIENIPYNETRGYVQRVLWHSLVFAWRESGKPQPVDGWLAPVKPSAPSIAEAGSR